MPEEPARPTSPVISAELRPDVTTPRVGPRAGSTRRSSNDIQSLVETTRIENRLLIEENKAHWSEQRERLERAVGVLEKLAVLQSELIAAVTKLGQAAKAAVELQAKDLEIQREAQLKEIEDQKPAIEIRMYGWSGVIKHFQASIRNPGSPGADVDVTFSLGGASTSRHADVVSKGAPFEPDFGDIGEYASAGEIQLICEISSSTKRHRYRFVAAYAYERNKGFWGSAPTLVRRSPQTLTASVLF